MHSAVGDVNVGETGQCLIFHLDDATSHLTRPYTHFYVADKGWCPGSQTTEGVEPHWASNATIAVGDSLLLWNADTEEMAYLLNCEVD